MIDLTSLYSLPSTKISMASTAASDIRKCEKRRTGEWNNVKNLEKVIT